MPQGCSARAAHQLPRTFVLLKGQQHSQHWKRTPPETEGRDNQIVVPWVPVFTCHFFRRPKDTQKRMLMATGPSQLLIKEERPWGAVWTLEDKRFVLHQPGNKKAQLCKELQAHSWHPLTGGAAERRAPLGPQESRKQWARLSHCHARDCTALNITSRG